MMPEARVKISAIDDSASVFTQSGQRIQRWAAESQSASSRFSEGFKKASNSITNLAGDMLGANNKVANLAEGLLTFAAGGAVATAVAAGITLIGGGINLLSAGAQQAQADYDALIKRLNRASDYATVGSQMDQLAHKIGRLNEGGILGAATRFTRATLSRSLLGQLFGVQSADELQSSFDQAAGLYKQMQDGFAAERAKTEAEADKKVQDARKRRAEQQKQEFLDQALSANDARLRAEGGPRVVGGRDFQVRKSDAGDRVAAGDLPQTGVDAGGISIVAAGFEAAAEQFRAFNVEAMLTDEILGKLAGDTLVSLTDGLTANFAAIGRGRGVFEGLARAALKPIADEAKGYGRLAIGKGLVKIKDSIWPPNPAGLASGIGMVTAGGALVAAAGQVQGGGGGVGASAGGAGAGYGATTRGEDIRDTGKVTFVVPDDFSMRPTDPRVMEWLSEAFEQATGRRTLFVPASAIAQGR